MIIFHAIAGITTFFILQQHVFRLRITEASPPHNRS
jgi:hypothetical protein